MQPKHIRIALASVFAIALSVAGGRAEAASISYDSTFNPNPDVLINNNGDVCTGNTVTSAVSSTDCNALEFTYTLVGFNPLTDTLASGTLTLTFYDDNEPGPDQSGNHDETVNISLDGVLTTNSPLLVTNGGSPLSPQFDVLAELQDGALTIILTLPSGSEGNNDFFFASARLIARTESENSLQTPEPAGLLLFGTFLLGFAARARQRARR